MHAVVFEFRPHPEHRETYFAIVAELRPELQRVPGFIANERFASRTDPHGLVSVSLWADEAAILRWRAHAGHRVAQRRGKTEVFAGYRLRVAETVDAAAPCDVRLAIGPGIEGEAAAETFDGIPDPQRRLVLGALAAGQVPERLLGLRVLRDYGPDAIRPGGHTSTSA